MISAHSRRSIRELTRRRGRSSLTIATIAVATAGVWLFAIPDNVDATMNQRVRSDAMHTARLAPTAVDLTPAQLASLRSVDNVSSLDTRTLARTEIRIDGRTQGVILVGVADFEQQMVNIVSLTDGAFPDRPGEVVTDTANARTGRFRGEVGDTVELRTHTGRWERVGISGSGGTVRYSSEVAEDAPVLYLANADVQRVMNYPAPNSIDVVAVDPAPAAVNVMVTELRSMLSAELDDIAYWDVLEVWREGKWPGSDDFGNFIVVFYVLAGIALVSALILIFTTMNTMVREQIREIGMMKAIGGTPAPVASGFFERR